MSAANLARRSNLVEIEAQVQAALAGRVRDLRLSSRDDGIAIHGYSASYHEKQLAQHAVMEACTQPLVANEIEVAAAGSPARRNGEIYAWKD